MRTTMRREAASWLAPLHVRMFVSVAAACLLLVGLDGWWTWQSRKVAIAADMAETANLARSLAQHAHNVVQVADAVLLAIRERVTLAGLGPEQLGRFHEIMRERVKAIPALQGLFVFDQSGNQIVNSVFPTPSALNIADRDYFRYHRDHTDPDLQIGRPIQSGTDGSWLVTVSRRFDLADGEFGGIVVAAISVEFLERFYRSFDVGKTGGITLYRTDGIAMVGSSGSGGRVGADISHLDLFRKYLPQSPASSFGVSSADGVSRLVSYRRVEDYPLVTVVAHRLDQALVDWRQDAWVHASITAAAALALAMLGCRFGQQIRQSEMAERRFRMLANNVGDIVILRESRGYPYISPASRRLLGYEPEEMARLGLEDVIHPDDLPAVLQAQARLSATNPVVISVHRNFRKDGKIIWVEAVYRRVDGSGEVGPQAITVRDVTARVEAERRERQAADRATLALEATNDFVFAVDAEWRVTYVNNRARTAWKEFDSADGQILWDAVPTLVGTVFEACYRRAMVERIPAEATAQGIDGRWLSAHAAPLADRGLFVFFRDVSDSKRLEASLIEARRAAEMNARAKSEFLANMSHELRTPLTAVIGFSEMIERDAANPALWRRHREYAQDIRQSGEHLLGLINDILEYSKVEAGHLLLHVSRFDPREMVEGCVRMMRPRAERMNLALHIMLEEAPAMVVADEKRVRQIVLNLLSNAVKFTPAGGSIDIDCRASDGLSIAVRDSGIGIPENEIDRVMEAFVQVEDPNTRAQEGTGLGLPLSRRLAEMHGGTLDIKSILGTGTIVTLHIPGRTPDAAASPSPGADRTDRGPQAARGAAVSLISSLG